MPPLNQNPTILVTGGCGFIGTWVLLELLRRGLPVVVLDACERPARWERVIGAGSEQVPLVQGSLLDRGLLGWVFAEHGVTYVIHLAALLTPACQADPWEGCRVNVLGSVALFEQVRTCAGRIRGFSYASSVAVFGDEPDHATGPTEEGNHPATFYGVFKKSFEMIAGQYWRQFQIASVGIRPQVAYGPEREVGLTAGPSLAARAAARGEAFSISYTGRIGYDYVEDVARAFVRGALETPPGAPVVDLPGEVADVDQVLAAIVAAAPEAAPKLSVNGPPIPAQAPPNPCFISTLYPDWTTTPLVEGIRRTVEFYRVQAPGAAGRRTAAGERSGRTVSHLSSGHLQTPAGAAGGRPAQTPPPGKGTPYEPRFQADAGRAALDGAIPKILGRVAGGPCGLRRKTKTTKKGKT